jgi:hypothetical protein
LENIFEKKLRRIHMKKRISKTRRLIETFVLIGFFILFITLAVGLAGSKVGTGAKVPLCKPRIKWVTPDHSQITPIAHAFIFMTRRFCKAG